MWAGGFLEYRGRKGRGCRGALGIQGKLGLSLLLTALHTRGTLEPEFRGNLDHLSDGVSSRLQSHDWRKGALVWL